MKPDAYRCVRCGGTRISIKGYFKYDFNLDAYIPDPYNLYRSNLADACNNKRNREYDAFCIECNEYREIKRFD
jgi:hypothetical protein